MKTIAIIGGGFSGVMTAVHLSRMAVEPLQVFIINSKNPFGKGTAYSTTFDCHLLNVRAGRMSALPDDKDNFVNWLKLNEEYKSTDINWLKRQFISRKKYGQYVSEILDNELKSKNTIKLIRDEVVDIVYFDCYTEIYLKNETAIVADKVVLALGNFLPAHPFPDDQDFVHSRYYIHDPWRAQLSGLYDSGVPVLLVGSGLTAIDVFLTLTDINYRGRIYITSRNGFLPEPHSENVNYTFDDDLLKYNSLYDIYKIVKRNLTKAYLNGDALDGALDVIRKHIHELWQKLSLADKRQFLRHLRAQWNIVRHRIPVPIHKKFIDAIKRGQIELIKGKITSVEAGERLAAVKINTKGSTKIIQVSKVINCTGPQIDYSKIDSLLLKNLLRRKYIQPHELSLGIEAQPDGTVIQPGGKPSPFLYTLGSSLTGVLWESVAVPELRVQAKTVAEKILLQFSNQQKPSDIIQQH